MYVWAVNNSNSRIKINIYIYISSWFNRGSKYFIFHQSNQFNLAKSTNSNSYNQQKWNYYLTDDNGDNFDQHNQHFDGSDEYYQSNHHYQHEYSVM